MTLTKWLHKLVVVDMVIFKINEDVIMKVDTKNITGYLVVVYHGTYVPML